MKSISWSKQEKIIILALIVISLVAWVFTVHHSQSMNSDMSMVHQPIILGAFLFLIMWTVMMIAMMLPAINQSKHNPSYIVRLLREKHSSGKAFFYFKTPSLLNL